MDFFEVIKRRRSIRRFTDDSVPEEVIEKALNAAVWAPNSSNIQSWNFYWVTDPNKKTRLIEACLGQSAARTAQHLVVVTANYQLWKRSQPHLVNWVEQANAPKPVQAYYQRLIPVSYRSGWFNLLGLVKWVSFNFSGLFRPVPRGPSFSWELQGVAVKSAALAAENFVLAVAAQDFDSCMMEGFDECRVKKLLGLHGKDRVVMVIAVGKASERGTWGPPFRIPNELVIHKI